MTWTTATNLLAGAFLAAGITGSVSAQSTYLANSQATGADPGAIYYNGYYYGSFTAASHLPGQPKAPNQMIIYRSKRLAGLFSSNDTQAIAITGPSGFWAPDFRLINGHTYVYYFDPQNKVSHVTESASADPFGPYTDHPEVRLPGYDWTVFQRADGTLWGFSSDCSILHIGKMSDPLHLASLPMTELATPSLPWESTCEEAPQPFAKTINGQQRIFLDYSTNAWRNDNYMLGLLTFTGTTADRLDDVLLWSKSGPVFQSANGVVSVGSNTVVQSPDGTQLWNVYHGRFHDSTNSDRQTRAQEITFANGVPNFGVPSAEGALVLQPSGTTGIPSRFLPAGTYDNDNANIVVGGTQINGILYSTQGWTDITGVGGAFMGTTSTSSSLQSYVMFSLDGTSLEVFGPEGPDFGMATVYIDGSSVGTVDLYSAIATPSVLLYKTPSLASRQHTVMFVNRNQKNPQSSGMQVGIDYFVVHK